MGRSATKKTHTHTKTEMNWHTPTKPKDFNNEVELTDTILVT
jgi:hypothetical protein